MIPLPRPAMRRALAGPPVASTPQEGVYMDAAGNLVDADGNPAGVSSEPAPRTVPSAGAVSVGGPEPYGIEYVTLVPDYAAKYQDNAPAPPAAPARSMPGWVWPLGLAGGAAFIVGLVLALRESR